MLPDEAAYQHNSCDDGDGEGGHTSWTVAHHARITRLPAGMQLHECILREVSYRHRSSRNEIAIFFMTGTDGFHDNPGLVQCRARI